jgi:DNA repair protein RecO (recombination protein O)
MSTLYREPGIILRSLRHGESSAIITVFTRGRGKIGLIAKGARRRIKGGTPLGLELFCEAEFVYYHKETRELQLLKELSLIDPHLGVRDRMSGMTIGSAVLELLLRCMKEEDPHPVLYDAAVATLRALDSQESVSLPLLWKFELELLTELGFRLQLERCALTGKPLAPPFQGPVKYRFRDGAFVSPGAASNEPLDGSLSAAAFASLSRLNSSSREFAGKMKVDNRVARELTSFIQRFLEYHLPISGRLKSLSALRWIKPTS